MFFHEQKSRTCPAFLWSPFNIGYTVWWTLRGLDIPARSVLTGFQLIWCNSVEYLLVQLELKSWGELVLVCMNVWVTKMAGLFFHRVEYPKSVLTWFQLSRINFRQFWQFWQNVFASKAGHRWSSDHHEAPRSIPKYTDAQGCCRLPFIICWIGGEC